MVSPEQSKKDGHHLSNEFSRCDEESFFLTHTSAWNLSHVLCIIKDGVIRVGVGSVNDIAESCKEISQGLAAGIEIPMAQYLPPAQLKAFHLQWNDHLVFFSQATMGTSHNVFFFKSHKPGSSIRVESIEI